jgi:phosphoribosylformylglycinamidine synthase
MSLSQMGTVTTEADPDLVHPSKLDNARHFIKTVRSKKQSKTEWRKRVLTIINQALNYTFPTHFTGKPVIDASKPRLKAAIIRKEVTQNAKWQMPCILPVLM